ncbi:MAG: ATP-dependent Clp protease ATP-binding subunit [Flavobacteriia bacterium]|nr:ATP-dependent Clp protease ATP-binding subunit [Flavobacteriia bacterium]
MQLNFTPRSQEILSLARKLARKYSHEEVNLDHLFLSLLKVDSFLIPFLEAKLGIAFDSVEQLVLDSVNSKKKDETSDDPKYGDLVKSCLDLCIQVSAEKSHSYISVEHLLYGLLNLEESHIIDYLIVCNIDFVKIQDELDQILSHDIIYNPIFSTPSPEMDQMSQAPQTPNPKPIQSYSVNLNELAREGEFNFILSNPQHIYNIEETLCRKTKSNVLLVGDAGVGKTALVESLAKRIFSLESNDYLLNKQVLSVDLSSMVAGTKYRGQFEERLKAFIDAVKKEKNIILFFDEIHTIVGAGNAEGSLDAANILKPHIARGEITCIGATTFEEYKKSIAKDPALRRRFNVVKIDEPTPKESVEIITNLCHDYSAFHAVDYTPEAIREAVNLSVKYINDRKLPDKAIDLIDQAGSTVKIDSYKKPAMAKNMEKVLMNEDVDESIKINVFSNYKSMLNKWGKKKSKKLPKVDAKDVRKIISKNFGVSLESLNETQSRTLKHLSSRMSKEVIGQDKAIEKIANSLLKTHCGLQDFQKPIGSFLFLGKTGVGKTLTAKSLAKNYFGSEKKLVYFDMSEFTESTSVSKFSGSSPGYVGYEKGGILTEKIKRDPHTVLLFDEIEKAHPVVLQSLLQVLEEGRLTDNSGEETSFKNCIIIFTSNLGADLIDKKGSVGFMSKESESSDKIFDEAKRRLSPELVNRFDGIVLFNNFSEDALNKIIALEFSKIKNKLNNKNIKCRLKPAAKKQILKYTIDQNLGGRPIRRIMQNEVEVAIAKFIINNDSNSVIVDYKDDDFLCYAEPSSRKKR